MKNKDKKRIKNIMLFSTIGALAVAVPSIITLSVKKNKADLELKKFADDIQFNLKNDGFIYTYLDLIYDKDDAIDIINPNASKVDLKTLNYTKIDDTHVKVQYMVTRKSDNKVYKTFKIIETKPYPKFNEIFNLRYELHLKIHCMSWKPILLNYKNLLIKENEAKEAAKYHKEHVIMLLEGKNLEIKRLIIERDDDPNLFEIAKFNLKKLEEVIVLKSNIKKPYMLFGFNCFHDTPFLKKLMDSNPEGLAIFQNCLINWSQASGNVTLSNDITAISDHAFINNDKIISIEAPNVEYIGAGGISNCKNLKSISLPKLSILQSRLVDKTFKNCPSIKSVTLPKALKDKILARDYFNNPSSIEFKWV